MDRQQQRVFPLPPGGPFMMPPPGLPEMAQGMMPQMMMQPQYGLYPGMMMAQGPSMVPVPPPPPMGMTPQLTQMLAESARGGRGSNVFFKTRLCNKWRGGNCPFGDKCTYAHGQHELRYIPPELLAQLEREQRVQEQLQKPTPSPSPGRQANGGKEEVAAMGEHQQQQQQQQQQPQHTMQLQQQHQQQQLLQEQDQQQAGDQRNKSQVYFKTRLCIRYMQTGYCARGASCTFAHGYEDLRLLGHDPQVDTPQHTPAGASRQQPARSAAAVDRARAISAMAGVGGGAAASEEAVREAVDAVRSGDAFRATPYADSAEDFVGMPENR